MPGSATTDREEDYTEESVKPQDDSRAIGDRPILALTMGDAAGIGPEIAVRALGDAKVRSVCRPVLIGDASVVRSVLEAMDMPLTLHCITDVGHASLERDAVNLIDLANIDVRRLAPGTISAMTGAAAYECIIRAVDLAMNGSVAGIVTGPIHKGSLNMAGHNYPGHTEILAERTGARDYAMMLCTPSLRVVLATIHLSLRTAIDSLDEVAVLRAIRFAHDAGLLLGIPRPRIAVPGLNPHAGEGGLFGSEEGRIIGPAIARAHSEGLEVTGPFPADTVFHRASKREFDFVIALYHDQGLIPIKLLGFGQGVNVTLGLPIVRTSVDHGTAFGKAWQFRADPGSLVEAVVLAARLVQGRRNSILRGKVNHLSEAAPYPGDGARGTPRGDAP